jgi:hypothetical protein
VDAVHAQPSQYRYGNRLEEMGLESARHASRTWRVLCDPSRGQSSRMPAQQN